MNLVAVKLFHVVSQIKTERNCMHCKNEYALSNPKNCGNRLKAILLMKFSKLELSNN